MTTPQWNLLSGAIWNLKQWLELRQWARRAGDPAGEALASGRIELWRVTTRRIRNLRLP